MSASKLPTLLDLSSDQVTQIELGSNIIYQNILAAPLANLDTTNFTITINGQSKDYSKQILTPTGLQVYTSDVANPEADENKIQCILQAKQSIKFDRKYSENKYCVQLALTLDRATNAAYQMLRKYKSNKNKQNVSPPSSDLQICQLILKKIPIKSKCLQIVFKKLSLHKIQILFENNSFFQELVKIICQLIYKVNIDLINPRGKQKININFNQQDSQQSIANSNDNSETQQRKSEEHLHKNHTFHKKKNKIKLTHFQQNVLSTYEHIIEGTKKLKKCYERINLILSMFTRQQRLSQLFYDLNKQLIYEYINENLHQIFGSQNNGNKCDKNSKTAEARIKKQSFQFQALAKLIESIKTVNISLGKSQFSFKIIKTLLLTEEFMIPWLNLNFQKIKINRKTSCKFFQFISLAAQISPLFVCTYYNGNYFQINELLALQVKWIFQTLNTAFPNLTQEIQLKDSANKCLDNLITISKITIKQTMSSINFGRAICKQLCETATNLRPQDIQFFTFVSIVNPYSRQQVIKFLFSFFRKFIFKLRNELKDCQPFAMKLMRSKKHYLLQVMQSIRKISQIDEIDFAIDSNLLTDIKSILQFYTRKVGRKKSEEKSKNDCIDGAYRAMIKNIKIEPAKQKDSQSQTYDSEQSRFKVKYD